MKKKIKVFGSSLLRGGDTIMIYLKSAKNNGAEKIFLDFLPPIDVRVKFKVRKLPLKPIWQIKL